MNKDILCLYYSRTGHTKFAMEEIAAALERAEAAKGKPTVIIAKTVKGKGVSFMENDKEWHGNDPNTEQYEKAAAELDALVAAAEKEAERYE